MPEIDDDPYGDTNDIELQQVYNWFHNFNNFNLKVGSALRQALDEVIDGVRTGRWKVELLEKTEKTYIGTKVEIILRDLFSLPRGEKLDIRVNGSEVDIKWTIRGAWMIPQEAINELCLVVTADDNKSVFSIGLIRASEPILSKSRNRDKKRSLRVSNENIKWMARNSPLPINLLLHLDATVRDQIFVDHKSGQKRINQLFRLVQNQIITRTVIETVAQQKDPLKRVRDARIKLDEEGIMILAGKNIEDRQIAQIKGIPIPKTSDEYISTSI